MNTNNFHVLLLSTHSEKCATAIVQLSKILFMLFYFFWPRAVGQKPLLCWFQGNIQTSKDHLQVSSPYCYHYFKLINVLSFLYQLVIYVCSTLQIASLLSRRRAHRFRRQKNQWESCFCMLQLQVSSNFLFYFRVSQTICSFSHAESWLAVFNSYREKKSEESWSSFQTIPFSNTS